jgi:glutamate carboxypeptidase
MLKLNQFIMLSDPVLEWAHARQNEAIRLIQTFVECESPSDSPKDLARFNDLLADSLGSEAVCRKAGTNLVCEFALPGNTKRTQILALGHGDTVWPLGTLKSMPFCQAEGRLWGPGVLDMKSGLVFFIFAMKALRELGVPVRHKVLLQVNSDEETGSRLSRALTEQNAKRSQCVLVLEPGTGLTGKLKTARKGIGDYRLTVTGAAAHAGVDFEKGASAVLELSKQLVRIAGFTSLSKGITVNPGVISGGTRSNVIAAEAKAHIDIRVPKLRDFTALEKKFQALRPIDKRCSLALTGGLNRPPLERTKGVVALFRLAQKLGKELGVKVEESATGGGSDGNFSGALGIPTLDGIGAVGEGAHAPHESILTNRIADRIALLAKVVAAIA